MTYNEMKKAFYEAKDSSTRMQINKQYHKECDEVLGNIIAFLGSKIKDDKVFNDYVKECWEWAKPDPDYDTFEDWFKGSIFSRLDKECMSDFIGHLYSKGADVFEDYMDKIGFVDFVESVKGDKSFDMGYSAGTGIYATPRVSFIVK